MNKQSVQDLLSESYPKFKVKFYDTSNYKYSNELFTIDIENDILYFFDNKLSIASRVFSFFVDENVIQFKLINNELDTKGLIPIRFFWMIKDFYKDCEINIYESSHKYFHNKLEKVPEYLLGNILNNCLIKDIKTLSIEDDRWDTSTKLNDFVVKFNENCKNYYSFGCYSKTPFSYVYLTEGGLNLHYLTRLPSKIGCRYYDLTGINSYSNRHVHFEELVCIKEALKHQKIECNLR